MVSIVFNSDKKPQIRVKYMTNSPQSSWYPTQNAISYRNASDFKSHSND